MTPNGEVWRFQKMEETLERHERDLYRGNGKPGLTTRMEKAEQSLDSIKYYARWILGILAAIGVAEFVNLIKH